jgi:hypothetical protein
MESLKKNKLLLSVFVIVFLVFIYFFFFRGSSAPTPAVLGVGVSMTSGTTPAGEQILTMLAQLQALNIDTSLFSGTAWTSLHDITGTPVTTIPGKSDLFAPIGQNGSTLASQIQISSQPIVVTPTVIPKKR